MNLRIIPIKHINPKNIHITDIKFKYIKAIKTKKHFSNYKWSRTDIGIYGIKGRNIYKFYNDYNFKTCTWSYKFICVNSKSYHKDISIFIGKYRAYPSIEDYLKEQITNNIIDHLFVSNSPRGIIELYDTVYIKKYKIARIKNELEISGNKDTKEKI